MLTSLEGRVRTMALAHSSKYLEYLAWVVAEEGLEPPTRGL